MVACLALKQLLRASACFTGQEKEQTGPSMGKLSPPRPHFQSSSNCASPRLINIEIYECMRATVISLHVQNMGEELLTVTWLTSW